MQSVIAIIVLVLLSVLYPYYYHEMNKYQSILALCRENYDKNARILNLPVCKNAYERILHGEKVELMCVAAKQENVISAKQCAQSAWWKQFAVYTFVTQMTDAYWKVMVPLLILGYMALRVLTHWLVEKSRITEWRHMFESMRMQPLPSSPISSHYIAPAAAAADSHNQHSVNMSRRIEQVELMDDNEDRYVATAGTVYYG